MILLVADFIIYFYQQQIFNFIAMDLVIANNLFFSSVQQSQAIKGHEKSSGSRKGGMRSNVRCYNRNKYGHYACEYECLVNNKEKTNYVDGK